MGDTTFSWELFTKFPVIGILRHLSMEEVKEILPIYKEQGLTTVEITMNTRNAGDMIRHAASLFGKSLNIGAGTVCSLADLDIALDAGAGFIVTPIVNHQVINECVRKGIPVFPGAFTPTEVYTALSLGAEIVKIFPANSLGPAYIEEIRGPLNQVKLLPTGGIGFDNCIDFLASGAAGLGIGSQLFSRDMIDQKDWKALADHFSLFVKKIGDYQFRSNQPENPARLHSADNL
ncbi:MAG TPA: bifunctional 4-hydroxy-2-oxoglutarate aldolase/2-dehydro-3-deoxy-phosphogluconate aldolase [Mucilaginibacter sp.]|jgi:2-dehydro-3-deoxyphosphogluconate aldolase/(4S)-4-hydroxy-2-oxoglutarate aldolase